MRWDRVEELLDFKWDFTCQFLHGFFSASSWLEAKFIIFDHFKELSIGSLKKERAFFFQLGNSDVEVLVIVNDLNDYYA